MPKASGIAQSPRSPQLLSAPVSPKRPEGRTCLWSGVTKPSTECSSRLWGDTTSAAAPARRGLGCLSSYSAGPQHPLVVAVAVHHPHPIERRVGPCRGFGDALVGDLVR